MGDKLRFDNDDYGDQYEPTDSEDEYSEEEKELLREVRERGRKKDQDSEQELMAFSDDDNDEDEDDNDDNIDEFIGDSDIERADDDADMPDDRDWGKKSRNYYNTDFVDPDYSTYTEKEQEMAKMEEEEAKKIQVRLLEQMKEKDFLSDDDEVADSDEEQKLTTKTSTKVKTDFSGLPKREQLRLLQSDSPEFFGLIDDFKHFFGEITNLVAPVMHYARISKVRNIPAFDFIRTYQNLALLYCSEISFYLLLKSKRIPIRNHPISNRLLQSKKLLLKVSKIYENIVKPKLQIIKENYEKDGNFGIDTEAMAKELQLNKKAKLSILDKYNAEHKLNGSEESDDENAEDNDAEAEENMRRGITYQIAKNKGLTPHRKKEARNPRVKHRSKFRKALIRRKGGVRTVRTETKRYAGEISGIKATVSKSVKFK